MHLPKEGRYGGNGWRKAGMTITALVAGVSAFMMYTNHRVEKQFNEQARPIATVDMIMPDENGLPSCTTTPTNIYSPAEISLLKNFSPAEATMYFIDQHTGTFPKIRFLDYHSPRELDDLDGIEFPKTPLSYGWNMPLTRQPSDVSDQEALQAWKPVYRQLREQVENAMKNKPVTPILGDCLSGGLPNRNPRTYIADNN